MSRFSLRHLRRCRLLFVLALCAWLGLAGSVFARTADCCAGMTDASMPMHQHGTPAPLHAGAGACHVDCACAHAVVALPDLPTPVTAAVYIAAPAHVVPISAPDHPHAPPLRPPLA